MKASCPSSGPATISPAAAPALWQISLLAGSLHETSLSVRVEVFAPVVSPLPVAFEHVSFRFDAVSSVVTPSATLNLGLALGPANHSNSPNLPPRLSLVQLELT